MTRIAWIALLILACLVCGAPAATGQARGMLFIPVGAAALYPENTPLGRSSMAGYALNPDETTQCFGEILLPIGCAGGVTVEALVFAQTEAVLTVEALAALERPGEAHLGRVAELSPQITVAGDNTLTPIGAVYLSGAQPGDLLSVKFVRSAGGVGEVNLKGWLINYDLGARVIR